METNSDSLKSENNKSFLSNEQKEQTIQNKFSNLKSNNLLNARNIIIVILIPFLIYLFYYIFIKEDESEDLNTLEKMISEEKQYFFIDVKSSELNINNDDNNMTKELENLFIGIKFGNINSGYSYNFGKNISTIISEKQKSTELELLKETKQGSKYSYKASVSLMNYKSDELEKIIFVKGFKTLLYDEKDNDFFYQYNADIKEEEHNIIKQYFNFLKDEIISELNKINKNSKNNFIKWVLAIPQNISQFEKQLIKNITTELEMFNIDLIYESEASSLAMFYDKTIPEKVKQKNKTFMLIDASGYSIDLTIYKIIDEKGSIKQLIETQSFNLGIIDISNKIINIFKEIFGKDVANKIKKNEPGEWVKILNEINKILENTNDINGIEIYEMRNYFRKKEGNYTYKNQTIKVDKININLPLSLIGKIIDENMNIINEKINDILNHTKKEKKINLDNIIITGGLSRNKIFKEKIKSNFSNENNDNIHCLSNYENVISKGAVIYGINPEKIKSRISPITIGIRRNDINNKKEDIELLVKKGEENDNYLIKYIKPISDEQDCIKINIYVSKGDFVDLEGLEKNLEGKIVLKLDKSMNEQIKLIIKYDTVIKFYANYENGKEVESFFEYYKL